MFSKIKKLFGSDLSEADIKNRRKIVIVCVIAVILAIGVLVSAFNLQTANDTDALAVMSENSTQNDDSGNKVIQGNVVFNGPATTNAEATTEAPQTTDAKKTTTKKTTSTYKKYDKEFLITAKTAADPYKAPIAAAGNYKTRDISKEKHTVKNIDTGEVVTSNGFDILCQVVNGEMGSGYSTEALKAQAVAAYTTILYCESRNEVPVLGLKKNYSTKIRQAVEAVEGLVCTYDGKVINAVFSASSSGVTAASENAWGGRLPYLISVEGKYDSIDPNYGVKVTVPITMAEMNLKYRCGFKLSNDPGEWFRIVSTYDGRYVKSVQISNGKTVSGDFIKSLFNLKSNAFTISYKNNMFTFTTYGYGHGVGMSQEGAQLYAVKDGLKFDQILKHYYTGIDIELLGGEQATTTTKKTTTKTITKTTTTKRVTTSKPTTTSTVKPTTVPTTVTTAEPTTWQEITDVPQETTEYVEPEVQPEE